MSDLARLEAAADWLVRLSDAAGDETVIAEWLCWCEAHPENLPTFQRMQALWQAAVPPKAGASPTHIATPRAGWKSRSRSWKRGLRVGIGTAAAAAAVLALIATVLAMHPTPRPMSVQSYSTPVGGRGLTVLPDGSKVEVGADSRIITDYSSAMRGVTVDAGDAFFSVRKDPRRPFVVSAGRLRVIAVGTAFNVRRGADRIVVAVQEGRVRVSDAVGDGPDLGSIGAGEEAVYLLGPRHLSVANIKTHDAAAWRDGILKYEHEPLAAVAADLNRYSTRRIVIADADIGELPFTGTIFSGRIDDALQALGDVFPVRVIDA